MDSRRFTVLWVILALLVPIPPPAVAQQPYVLGPEDVIEVTVYGHPDLTRTVAIPPDGKIALPLIGFVAAAGLSIEGLTQALIHAYEVYIRNPQVTVIVKEFRRLRVSVIGHVVRPGVYELKPGAAVLEALSAAGGLTERASMTEAQLIRASGESQPLMLEELLVRQNMRHNVMLQGGDTLIVPEDTVNRFYVLGDVARPGAFVLRGDVTVLQALAMAGGPVQRGAGTAKTLHIVRRNASPQSAPTYMKVERLPNNGVLLTVDLAAVMQRGDPARDMPVQAGDIIVVPEGGLSAVGSVVGILAGLATIFK